MFSRWQRIDIVLAALLLACLVAYFIPGRPLFTILSWIFVVLGGIRLLGILRRRLLWKIRNRLIVAGIFFTLTPIILISVFFLTVITVLLIQYNSRLVDNLQTANLQANRSTADFYLNLRNPEEIIRRLSNVKVRRPTNFCLLIFQRGADDRFRSIFAYPEDFPVEKVDVPRITADFREGYFLLDGRLLHGVFQQQGDLAFCIASFINQQFFDEMTAISDFIVRFRSPASGAVERGRVQIDAQEIENSGSLQLPFPYTYKYRDFDDPQATRLKINYFLIVNDYTKVFRTIRSSSRIEILKDRIEALKRAGAAGSRDELDLLQRELELLKRQEGERRTIDTSTLFRVLLILFGSFLVLSFYLGYRIVRVITKSVHQLSRGTERIRKGDFSYRIRINSHDQMRDLAESFNEMAAGIDRLMIEEKEKERLEEELRIARSIQLKLLPPDNFQCPEYELAAVNIPAQEIAGDYFDYFHEPGRALAVVVADVSGKGASAAFYMAELKGVMNYLQNQGRSPGDVVVECHGSLLPSFERVTFITMNIARLDCRQRTITLARAGHTPAMYVDAAAGECRELAPRGLAIGLSGLQRDSIEELTLPYQSGDILFFYSDGLSEMTGADEQMLGIGPLKKLLLDNMHLSAGEIRDRILDFTVHFSNSGIKADDLTFLLVKIK